MTQTLYLGVFAGSGREEKDYSISSADFSFVASAELFEFVNHPTYTVNVSYYVGPCFAHSHLYFSSLDPFILACGE